MGQFLHEKADGTLINKADAYFVDPVTQKVTLRSSTSLATASAKQPFSGSSSVTHVFTEPMTEFVISNDGETDLTFTIGGATYTVKAGEIFDDVFASFTSVGIVATDAFRAFGRG